MGYDVHLSVVFACDANDGVAALAREHLTRLPKDDEDFPHLDVSREAHWFLEALAARTGENPGPKGGLSLWGIVGNYTSPETFVEVLRPFWADLLSSKAPRGPFDFEHVLVFYEHEQSQRAGAYEILQSETERGVLEVRHHEALPFAWNQH